MYWLFESEQPYDDDCADGWLPDCRTVQVSLPHHGTVFRKKYGRLWEVTHQVGSNFRGGNQRFGVLKNSNIGGNIKTPDICPEGCLTNRPDHQRDAYGLVLNPGPPLWCLLPILRTGNEKPTA